jgi:lysophospholipase L1-like esterase
VRRAAVAALVVLVTAFAGCNDKSSPVTPDDGRPDARVLVIGDSNLFNAAAAVDEALRDENVDPMLHGVPGYGVKDFDTYWKAKLPELLQGEPAVVVVGLGTNDTLTAADVLQFGSRLDAMMEALGDRPVIWLTHVDNRPGVPATAGPAVNDAIRVAETRWSNLTVLDLAPTLAERPELLGDGLHFAGAGVEVYAQAIAEAVTSALSSEVLD